MYEGFHGLSERPFDLTPNPRYLYLSPTHREALANLKYAVAGRKSITVLLGEAGTGKTLMIRSAFSDQTAGPSACPSGLVHVNNPTLTCDEFLEHVAAGFGIRSDMTTSKTRFLGHLERVLRDRHAQGLSSALVIDEAQSLPHELLEEVRLLANMQSDTSTLLTVVLAGQPELAERLNEPKLRQLKQRVALRCTLKPFSFFETAWYIYGRLSIAGGHAARLFSRKAIVAIYETARGIPRTINVVCDNALLSAYALGRHRVDESLVREVCDDFDLATPPNAWSDKDIARRHSFGPEVPFTLLNGRPALRAVGIEGIMTRVADAAERLLMVASAEKARFDSRPSGWAPPAPYERVTPDLVELDDAVRAEINRLAQQLFLQPYRPNGSDQPMALRSVAFARVSTRGTATSITAATADVLARQTTGTVCAVDGNVRQPSLHESFKVPNAVGLSEALLDDGGTAARAQQLTRNLSLITAGFEGMDVLPSLGRETFGRVITELTTRFDFILVDAPPLDANSDALGVGASCNGVVLVVHAASTRREVARRAADMIRSASGHLVGVVLTNRTFPIPQMLYRWL